MVHRDASKMKRINKWLGLALAFCTCSGTGAWGAPVDIATSPLTSSAKPNIMLLIDNSGSMNNVVPEAPYAAATTYLASCPTANQVSPSSRVEVRIVSGAPKIQVAGDTSSYTWGAEDGERCFIPTGKYLAKLAADGGSAPTAYLPAEYRGNFLNWYFQAGNTTPTWTASQQKKPGTATRMEIAKEAATALLDTLNGVRVGVATYNGSNGATILEGVTDVTTGRVQLKSRVAGLTAFGATPLAEALRDLGEYFAQGQTGSLVLYPDSASPESITKSSLFSRGYSFTPPAPAPIEVYCQKNFVVLMTDGRPTSDDDIASVLQDYDGDCQNANPPCLALDRKAGQTYESSGTDYLDDVAAALRDIDLRPDLKDKAGIQVKNNLITYTIGFADDQVINDPLMRDTAVNGGGTFFTAGDSAELSKAFNSATDAIMSYAGSFSAVAANSTFYKEGTKIYQAGFDPAYWSGEVTASHIDAEGKVTGRAWLASEKMPAPDGRNIFTYVPSDSPSNSLPNGTGVLFAWNNLSTAQKALLSINDGKGLDRVNYLRGERTGEGSKPGEFRVRKGVLGDIVNSDPFYVGNKENYGYSALAKEGSTYAGFLSEKIGRAGMLYVGANDGMLHGFDAETGEEKFAYVPNGVYSNLSKLTVPGYVHQYYVDGPPWVGDAYVNGDWRSILVGSLGAGGRGVFALDVTDPKTFGASNVLWDISPDTLHPDLSKDLGYVFGPPSIVRLKEGAWVALFGNGYNSNSEMAKLFVVNLQTREVKVISTDSTTSNGLGPPVPVDTDGDFAADYAYAGDLQGNLWKFDLAGNSSSTWKVAYKLFTARDSSDRVQPITTRPTVGQAANGDIMVLFGTGKFIGLSDLKVSGTSPVHSFYGIKDKGAAITDTKRIGLQAQTIIQETSTYRLTSKNPVADSKDGWYLDLLGSSKEGEMVVSPALLVYGKVVFTTLIPPKGDPCEPKGDSWLMVMDALSGIRPNKTVLDRNQDRKVIEDDDVEPPGGGTKQPVSGTKQDGIVEVGGVIETNNDLGILMLGDKGLLMDLGKGAGQARQSWRQLR
jgi:type IV pilus assembly protein PilY1